MVGTRWSKVSRKALSATPEPVLPSGLEHESFCYLTTRGRRTGRPHRIEIWFALRGDRLYLLAEGGDRSDWVRNLRADPAVRVRIGALDVPGRARAVADPGEEALARRLLAAKYQGWRDGEPMSDWACTALAIAVQIDPSHSPSQSTGAPW